MASGKQLSFMYGEVSPTQFYKSNDVVYGNALSKMRNFFVQASGGSANRPGFISEGVHDYQGAIPTVGGVPGIKGFFWKNPVSNQNEILEYYYNAARSAYSLFVNGFETLDSDHTSPNGYKLSGALPQEIEFTTFDNRVAITPSLYVGVDTVSSFLQYGENPGVVGNSLKAIFQPAANASSTLGYGYEGTNPWLPVSYMVTEIDKNNVERIVGTFSSGTISSPTVSPGPSTIVHPTATISTYIQVTLGTVANTKRYNLYRSSGRSATFFKFVGSYSLKSTDISGGTIRIDDYGAEDASILPPTDLSLMGGANAYNTTMRGIKRASYYQQRMIVSYTSESVYLKNNELAASKIGASYQMWAPLIYRDTEAFSFNVPVSDGTPVVNHLAMERLIVFTQKSAWIIRGGNQGIFTPTQVNPLLLSQEGCSTIVAPKTKGRRGYFLNYAHNKLMAIEFGLDGNATCYLVSTLSEHLLTEDIHTMEVTGGKEDTVYLLRRDGKMIRITMNDAAPGFSLVETDGYIENIYVKRVKRDYYPYVPQSIASARQDPEYDALMAYIIRDGVRYTERLAYREDVIPEGFIYADQASIFGERLAKKPDGSYGRIVGTDILFSPQVADGCRINIVGTTYEAGETLELYSTAAIAALNAPSDVARLHAYYEDEDGIVQFIRFVSQGVGVSADPTFTHVYNGYFETDVPESLQDSETANPSDKLAIQTRWLLASNLWDVVYTDGTELSIFADGDVVSSPLNPNKDTLTAQSFTVALPDYYCWGVVGRPYRSEMASMNIEASDQRTLSDSHKIVNAIGVAFENSYGGFYGMVDQDLEAMSENNWREDDNFNAPLTGFTGDYQIIIPSEWTRSGRTAIIQVDPVPMTVLAMYPKGLASD